jgi:LmbE family N-acetylglucosaminyl deacetylase
VAPPAGTWSITPDAFGLPLERPSFAVNVEPWVARKLQAIACHHTQFRDDNPFSRIGAAEARQLLGTEYFRRAPKNLRACAFERCGEPVAG